MLRALDQRDAWRPVIAGLIALAWLTIWEQSPYGRYLDHGQWLEVGFAAKICRSLPAGSLLLPAFLYVFGWLLMTFAMMLPTTLPLLALFARVTSDKSDRALLLTLVIGGYLAIWTLFGVVAHAADMGLHAMTAGNSFLSFNGWIISAIVLAIAGFFQFSRFKYRCLDKCRTPSALSMSIGGVVPSVGNRSCLVCIMACFASVAAGQSCF
jgi:predicted metal-binding membrane protein